MFLICLETPWIAGRLSLPQLSVEFWHFIFIWAKSQILHVSTEEKAERETSDEFLVQLLHGGRECGFGDAEAPDGGDEGGEVEVEESGQVLLPEDGGGCGVDQVAQVTGTPPQVCNLPIHESHLYVGPGGVEEQVVVPGVSMLKTGEHRLDTEVILEQLHRIGQASSESPGNFFFSRQGFQEGMTCLEHLLEESRHVILEPHHLLRIDERISLVKVYSGAEIECDGEAVELCEVPHSQRHVVQVQQEQLRIHSTETFRGQVLHNDNPRACLIHIAVHELRNPKVEVNVWILFPRPGSHLRQDGPVEHDLPIEQPVSHHHLPQLPGNDLDKEAVHQGLPVRHLDVDVRFANVAQTSFHIWLGSNADRLDPDVDVERHPVDVSDQAGQPIHGDVL